MEKRNTIQKQLVLDAVAQLADHPTADEVYAHIAQKHPTVSKATVYRNLSSLSEDGVLRHVRMPEGADRFDHTLTPHFHIECICCGALCDVCLDENKEISRKVEQMTCYCDVQYDIVFTGVCPACQKHETE